MKIATWNVERPKQNTNKSIEIVAYLKKINADIFILTETNDFIELGDEYFVFHTSAPAPLSYRNSEISYAPGEKRVSIFSKYPLAQNIKGFATFSAETAICVNLLTPLGELAVYGTIIGVLGNKGDQFKNDLDTQLSDFENISAKAENFCISGDLNTSFSDSYYFTKDGREKLEQAFNKHGLRNYTANIKQNIDHIVLTEKFVGIKKIAVTEWNETANKETRLSDHKGVMLEIF